MRDRNWRRGQAKRVTRRRVKDLVSSFWGSFISKAQPRNFGHLRKDHYGCGCSLCKPWKWGKRDRVRHSEKRRLLIDTDE